MYKYGFNTGFKRSSVGFDPDAQAYFDSIGDVPEYAKTAWNNFVVGLKANSLHTNLIHGLPILPTRTKFGSLREYVSNSVLGTQVYTNTNTVNPSPIFNFPRAWGSLNGITSFNAGASSDGAFQTGLIADSFANPRTIASIYQDDDTLNAGFNYGAFGGGSNSSLMQKNVGANKTVRTDGFTGATGTGRVDYLSTLDGIRHIATIDTDLNVYENGINKGTKANTAGSPGNLEYLLGGYRTGTTNGASALQTCGLWLMFNKEFSDAEALILDGLMSTFQTEILRTGSYDFSVLMDGDSHTVYYNSQLFQNTMYELAGLAEVNGIQMGVSGVDFDGMITTQAAKMLPRIVSMGGTYYVIVWEGTNQISGGTNSADTLTKLNTYCGNLKTEAAGKGITLVTIVPTLLAREFIGEDAKIITSGEYNTDLLGSTPANVDHVYKILSPYTSYRGDFGSDAAFISDQRTKAADLTFFIDGIHLVDGVNGSQTAVGTPLGLLIKTLEGL